MRHRIIDVITGVRPSELVFETREKAEEWLQGYQVAEAYKRDHYRIVPFEVPHVIPADQPNYVTAITDGDGITRHLSRPIRLL